MNATVDKQRHDITQIQKYLNGKLDAKAMHQLEREAQHDPFLMDAIEGYEASANNQSANLNRLSQRLQERVEEKQRRIIPWWMMAAAAGVIGFMAVVGLLYKTSDPVVGPIAARNEPLPADTIAKSLPPATIDSTPVLAMAPPRTKETKAPRQYRNDRTLVISEVPRITDTTKAIAADPKASAASELPLDERVMDVIAKQRDSGEMPAVVAISKKPLSQPLPGKVEGLTKKEREGRQEYNNSYYLGNLANVQSPKVDVKRKVVAADDNDAVATTTGLAATSKLKNSLNAVTAKDSVNTSMGYIGASGRKETKDARSQLAEVTVMRTENTARPVIGIEAYNAYITQQALLPAGEKTGDVKLKFDVSANGTISNISVIKSLSTIADAKAKNIIVNGPSWKGDNSGKSQQVIFTVTFRSL